MWQDWTPIPVHVPSPPPVLERFPSKRAGLILQNVVRSVQDTTALKLRTRQEVDWCLEVLRWVFVVNIGSIFDRLILRYGLGHESPDLDTTEVASIYCDWLSVLLPYPRPNIPPPITKDRCHLTSLSDLKLSIMHDNPAVTTCAG